MRYDITLTANSWKNQFVGGSSPPTRIYTTVKVVSPVSSLSLIMDMEVDARLSQFDSDQWWRFPIPPIRNIRLMKPPPRRPVGYSMGSKGAV